MKRKQHTTEQIIRKLREAESGSSKPDLSDLPNAASTVIEAARWRLRRVAKLLTLAARQAPHETRGRGGE